MTSLTVRDRVALCADRSTNPASLVAPRSNRDQAVGAVPRGTGTVDRGPQKCPGRSQTRVTACRPKAAERQAESIGGEAGEEAHRDVQRRLTTGSPRSPSDGMKLGLDDDLLAFLPRARHGRGGDACIRKPRAAVDGNGPTLVLRPRAHVRALDPRGVPARARISAAAAGHAAVMKAEVLRRPRPSGARRLRRRSGGGRASEG